MKSKLNPIRNTFCTQIKKDHILIAGGCNDKKTIRNWYIFNYTTKSIKSGTKLPSYQEFTNSSPILSGNFLYVFGDFPE